MKFHTNEGMFDRVVRGVLGVAALLAGYYSFTGVLQIVAYVVGVVLLVTGFVGFCGLYTVLHISTKKK